MAIGQPSELVAEIRGSIGDRTFRWHKGTQVIQRKSSPGIHTTPKARASKNNFGYNAGLIFKSSAVAKARLKYWNRGNKRSWNLFWMAQLKLLPAEIIQIIPVPYQDSDLELDLTVTKVAGADQWRIEWTQRTREDEFVEFLTVYYTQGGRRTESNRDAIPMNLGQNNILAYGFICLITITTDSRATDARFGKIYCVKRGIDYNQKPNLE